MSIATREVLEAALARDRGGDAEDYDAEEFTASHDTLSDFITRWGEPSRTIGEVCFWDRVQTRPGKTRGDLVVMPTVDGTLTYFTGEV